MYVCVNILNYDNYENILLVYLINIRENPSIFQSN